MDRVELRGLVEEMVEELLLLNDNDTGWDVPRGPVDVKLPMMSIQSGRNSAGTYFVTNTKSGINKLTKGTKIDSRAALPIMGDAGVFVKFVRNDGEAFFAAIEDATTIYGGRGLEFYDSDDYPVEFGKRKLEKISMGIIETIEDYLD
jgi:hypothetical protein